VVLFVLAVVLAAAGAWTVDGLAGSRRGPEDYTTPPGDECLVIPVAAFTSHIIWKVFHSGI